MKLRTLLISTCLTAGVALSTAPVVAAVRDCRTAETTGLVQPSVKTERRANHLFRDIAYGSEKALADVDQLQAPGFGDLLWAERSHHLNSLRAQVNNLGDQVCNLETMRNELTPLQQRALDTISEKTSLMANDTHAVEFANAHDRTGWAPEYRDDLNNLYREAAGLAQYANHVFLAD